MSCKTVEWQRHGAGHYESTTGRWSIRCWRGRAWWVFRDGLPWGLWVRYDRWCRYLPFGTLQDALAAIEAGA